VVLIALDVEIEEAPWPTKSNAAANFA